MAPVTASAALDPTAARHEESQTIKIASDRLNYTSEFITAQYEYQNTHIERVAGPCLLYTSPSPRD